MSWQIVYSLKKTGSCYPVMQTFSQLFYSLTALEELLDIGF
jgi:hypothetical protein